MNDYGFNTFTITSEPYYDPFQQQYKNILTINVEPKGPLKHFVTRLGSSRRNHFNNRQPLPIPIFKLVLISLREGNVLPISPLRFNTPRLDCGSYLMTPSEIPDLITFLQSNNYQIDTQITNMLNQSEIKLYNQKIVFSASYYGINQPNICYIK
jgi:hypothetical protein